MAEKRRYWCGGRREHGQDEFFLAALDRELWEPGDETGWDTCWWTGMPDPSVFETMKPGQTVNHIPGNNALTVKSRLYETLLEMRTRMIDQDGADADTVRRLGFFPRTYSMPRDYHALQRAAMAEPDKWWILKPKNAARGKGIRVIRDVATVPVGQDWMVQEYIERPHVMSGHKYVLRLYVLFTSVEPLRVYLFEEGSQKLASVPYDPDDFNNVYSHLTNPDVNARNQEAASPVVFIPMAKYRAWLRDQGHDDAALFARIHDLLTLTAIAARESLYARTAAASGDTRGCYELLGIDCLVDADLKPWILECNLSPSLEVCCAPHDGGIEEEQTKRGLTADLVSMQRLNEVDSPDLPDDPEERIRAEAEEEMARAGRFRPLFPGPDARDYLRFFPFPRLADMVLVDAGERQAVARPRAARRHAREIIAGDRLALYGGKASMLYRPNQTASWIWLQAVDGVDPGVIADELTANATIHPEAGAIDDWAIRNDVWTALADWAAAGLIRQRGLADTDDRLAGAGGSGAMPPDGDAETSVPVLTLGLGHAHVDIDVQCPAARERLAAPLAGLVVDGDDQRNHGDRHGQSHHGGSVGESHWEAVRHHVVIVRSSGGYGVAVDGALEAESVLMERLPAVVSGVAARHAAADGAGLALSGVVVPGPDHGHAPPDAVFVAEETGKSWDLSALVLAQRWGSGFAGTLVPRGEPADGLGLALGLPGRIPNRHVPKLVDMAGAESLAGCETRWYAWGVRREEGHLIPASRAVSGTVYRISTILVPLPARGAESGTNAETDAAGNRQAAVEILGLDDAMAALLPSAIGAHGRRPDLTTIDRLSEWLGGRRVLGFRPGDLNVVLEALPGHLADG